MSEIGQRDLLVPNHESMLKILTEVVGTCEDNDSAGDGASGKSDSGDDDTSRVDVGLVESVIRLGNGILVCGVVRSSVKSYSINHHIF